MKRNMNQTVPFKETYGALESFNKDKKEYFASLRCKDIDSILPYIKYVLNHPEGQKKSDLMKLYIALCSLRSVKIKRYIEGQNVWNSLKGFFSKGKFSTCFAFWNREKELQRKMDKKQNASGDIEELEHLVKDSIPQKNEKTSEKIKRS